MLLQCAVMLQQGVTSIQPSWLPVSLKSSPDVLVHIEATTLIAYSCWPPARAPSLLSFLSTQVSLSHCREGISRWFLLVLTLALAHAHYALSVR